MMVYIMRKVMAVKAILFYSLRMPADMVIPICGVCIITMNTFMFLLPALLGGLLGPQYHPRNLTAARTPPGTPRARRNTDEARHKLRRQSLGLPNGGQRSDDDDEEKENQQAPKEEDLLEDLLSRLLKAWGEAIDQLQEQISQDLKGFKQRLGIRS